MGHILQWRIIWHHDDIMLASHSIHDLTWHLYYEVSTTFLTSTHILNANPNDIMLASHSIGSMTSMWLDQVHEFLVGRIKAVSQRWENCWQQAAIHRHKWAFFENRASFQLLLRWFCHSSQGWPFSFSLSHRLGVPGFAYLRYNFTILCMPNE